MNSAIKINNATQNERRGESTKLLILSREHLQRSEFFQEKIFGDLPELLNAGDLLVINDAATVPSSLKGVHQNVNGSLASVEIRLVQSLNTNPGEITLWRAVVFGEGDWKIPTEKRSLPPPLKPGDLFRFSSGLVAKIILVESNISDRLIRLEFLEKGPGLWNQFYSQARPIQYSYLKNQLEIWDQQTIFSGPPVAIEPPSASFAFTWDLLRRLEIKGVQIANVTHSTGISNTGDPGIDSQLPFPEITHLPLVAQEKILAAKKNGQKIIAVGTGVVRALEGWGALGFKRNEIFLNDLKIQSQFHLQIVDGLITGFHEPGGSHLHMLSAFLDSKKLREAYGRASKKGYLWHEYGDLCLIA